MNIKKLFPVLCLLVFMACTNNVFGQTSSGYQKKADALLNTRDFKKALKDYDLAIKKCDKNDKARQALLYFESALCQEGMNQYDDALKSYNTAIKLNPNFRAAYWNRGVMNEKNGDFQSAIDDYNNAIANTQSDDSGTEILYANVAYCESRLGEYAKALKADTASLAINPHYGRAYSIGGDIYIQDKNYSTAVENYTLAIFNNNENDKQGLSYLYLRRGDAKSALGKIKDAINDYSYAILLDPDYKFAYWNRGVAYYHNGDYLLAADDYTKAISYFKGDNINLSRLYDNRAANEIGLNQFDKAIQDDSISIKLNSDNNGAYFNMAIAYTQKGDYGNGIVYFRKLLGLVKDNKKELAVLYYEIANNEYFLNEFDKVIDDCTKAISIDPGYSDPYYYRAKVYLKKQGDKQLAMDDFNKVIALDTTKKSVSYIFSLLYTGKADEAISILQNDLLTAQNNENIMADYYNLACLYSLINEPEEANIYLKKAIDSGYSKKYAIADADLDNIRNTDGYKTIIAGAAN